MDEEKIKASIASLVQINSELLAQMKVKCASIATRDTDMEVFIRDNIVNNTTGRIASIATVSADYANKVLDEIRMLDKRIQDNVVTIYQLVGQISPYSLSGIELHDFNVPVALYKSSAKGGCLNPGYTLSQVSEAITAAEQLKLDSIRVPVLIDVSSSTSSAVSLSESNITLFKSTVDLIQQSNLAVFVEAYPWIGKGTVLPKDWDPADLTKWFVSWESVILQLVGIINSIGGIPVLIIGGNFDKIDIPANQTQWVTMLQHIKAQFAQLITYRTSWWFTTPSLPYTIEDYNNKLNNPMFGELDFISMSGFFELTDTDDPDINTLINAWIDSTTFGTGNYGEISYGEVFGGENHQNIVSEIEAFNTKWGKRIMFGEFGYADRLYTNQHPSDPNVSSTISEEAQQTALNAFFQVFKDLPWFLGFMLTHFADTGSNYCILGKTAESDVADMEIDRTSEVL